MPTNEGPENTAPSITFSSRVAMSQLKRATSDEKVIRGAVFSGPEVMSACHITILTYYNNANIIEAMEMEFGQNLCLPCFFPAKGILFAAYKIFIQENFFLANWIDFAIDFVIDSAINLAIREDKSGRCQWPRMTRITFACC